MGTKNILGMEMTEWKNLSGLADPYSIKFVEARNALDDLPDYEPSDTDDAPDVSREVKGVAKSKRLAMIAHAARALRNKTMAARTAAETMTAREKLAAKRKADKLGNELALHRKTFVKEGLEDFVLFGFFLEDEGISLDKFDDMLGEAIMANDYDALVEFLNVEEQCNLHYFGEAGKAAVDQDIKDMRLPVLKKLGRARALRARNASAVDNTPAVDRFRAKKEGELKAAKLGNELTLHRAMVAKHRGESIDDAVMWTIFLEEKGTNPQEFSHLINLAIESNDEDLTLELLAVEAQLDELLGGVGFKQGFKQGYAGNAANAGLKPTALNTKIKPAPPAVAPASPAQAAPPAPAAQATPPAAPAAPAQADPAQQAQGQTVVHNHHYGSDGQPAKPKMGLLGSIGKAIGGVAKVAKGAAGVAMAPVAAAARAAAPAKAESILDFENFIAEEFGISAEEYVEICERAFESNDVEMIEASQQIEGAYADEVARFKIAREKLTAADKKKKMDGMVKDMQSRSRLQRAMSTARKGAGASAPAASDTKDKAANEALAHQLQLAGYTDEFIEARTKAQQDAGKRAMNQRGSDWPSLITVRGKLGDIMKTPKGHNAMGALGINRTADLNNKMDKIRAAKGRDLRSKEDQLDQCDTEQCIVDMHKRLTSKHPKR